MTTNIHLLGFHQDSRVGSTTTAMISPISSSGESAWFRNAAGTNR
jgi:hypothetical protein